MKKVGLLIIALALALSLCACGEEEPAVNEFVPSVEQSAPSGQPQVTVVSSPAGLTEQMVLGAGFRLGVDTPEDIVAMFGQPQSIEENEYSAGKVIRYEYSFGAFEFDGTLYYVEGFAGITGPQGIAAGMTLQQAAELICAGSSARLDGSGEVILYGDESGDYGKFTRLTEEFVGEYGVYQLDYRASVPAGRLKLTVNFDGNMIMTAFMLQLS